MHDLSKPIILDESRYHIATVAEVLNTLDIGLDFLFEVFDLSLILGGETLDSLVEDLFLLIFLCSQQFVFIEKFNLFFEDGFIISCKCMKKVVLLTMFLHNLLIHISQILLG